jgi:uncharacterized protein (DUF2147 family)
MIKNSKVILVLFWGILNQLLFAQDLQKEENMILGFWLMPDNEGIIEIYKVDNFYNGKIIWMLEKEKDRSLLKDKENPVDSLKNRPVLGIEVMRNYKYDEDGVWNGGTFYAAKKGKTLEPDFVRIDENTLDIEVSFFLFSKTIRLTRIDKKHLESLN